MLYFRALSGSTQLIFAIAAVVFLSTMIGCVSGSPTAASADAFDMCPKVPYCEHANSPIPRSLRLKCTAEWLLRKMPSFMRKAIPVDTSDGAATASHSVIASSSELRRMAILQLEDLVARIQGQDHAIPSIVNLIRTKLESPSDPLILQFAGDHGVGKTALAKLISLSLSLWSASGWRPGQDGTYGDNMLIVSGSGYAGLTKADARKYIVPKILQHAKQHPFGIILIDDMTAMEPEVVDCLQPLFGRSEHFPEEPTVDLRKLIVILTTDFGKQGLTQNKSPSEISAMVDEQFGNTYGIYANAKVHTFPFLPMNNRTVKNVFAQRILSLPCRYPQVVTASYGNDDLVLQSIVEDRTALMRLRKENGHALLKMLDVKLDQLVRRRIDAVGIDARFSADFFINMNTAQIEMKDDLTSYEL